MFVLPPVEPETPNFSVGGGLAISNPAMTVVMAVPRCSRTLILNPTRSG